MNILRLIFFWRKKKKLRARTLTKVPPSIPNDLIRSILLNLPLKSLCRFRCVSKFFHSTISDDCFLSFSNTISSTDCIRGTGLIKLTHKIHYYPKVNINNTRRCFIRQNDTTISKLPSLLVRFPPSLIYGVRRRVQFGYDPISNKHKVLITMFTTNPYKESSEYQSHVFVEGGVSWRRLKDSPLHHPCSDSYVCIGGIIYYKARTSAKNPKSDVVVVEFNLGLETFRFIPLPIIGDSIQGLGCELMRLNGHYLVLVDLNPHQYNVGMWLLEDLRNLTWIHKTFISSYQTVTRGSRYEAYWAPAEWWRS